MTFNSRIREFIQSTKHTVYLPNMYQYNGLWIEDENGQSPPKSSIKKPHECCFGARVARAVMSGIHRERWGAKSTEWGYSEGRKYMELMLDVTNKELNAILYACGTGLYNSFDTVMPWHSKPQIVYDNLIKIERRPKTSEVIALDTYARGGYNPDYEIVRDIYKSLCQPIPE